MCYLRVSFFVFIIMWVLVVNIIKMYDLIKEDEKGKRWSVGELSFFYNEKGNDYLVFKIDGIQKLQYERII